VVSTKIPNIILGLFVEGQPLKCRSFGSAEKRFAQDDRLSGEFFGTAEQALNMNEEPEKHTSGPEQAAEKLIL
jgi:hypothetical protein